MEGPIKWVCESPTDTRDRSAGRGDPQHGPSESIFEMSDGISFTDATVPLAVSSIALGVAFIHIHCPPYGRSNVMELPMLGWKTRVHQFRKLG